MSSFVFVPAAPEDACGPDRVEPALVVLVVRVVGGDVHKPAGKRRVLESQQ